MLSFQVVSHVLAQNNRARCLAAIKLHPCLFAKEHGILLVHIKVFFISVVWPLPGKKMLSPIQPVTDEKVESFVLPITDSNCHVMKLMFCRIYNLILMVFLFHPLLSHLIFAQLFHNKRNRTMREGSLILFSFDSPPFFSPRLLEVKQEPCHQAFPKLWFT